MIADTHEQFLKRLKKIFLSILAAGIVVFVIAISQMDTVTKELVSIGRSNLASFAYALEFSRQNGNSNIYYSDDGPATSVAVVVYHGILDKYDGSDINTTVQNFKDQMFTLKRYGYTTITSDDLYRFMRGEIQLPKRSVMITFDDGRRDSYIKADPLLKALDFKATIFVISHNSLSKDKSPYYLDEADIKRMAESGRWDIEAHTNDGHDTFPIDQKGDKAPYYGNLLWIPELGRLENAEEFRNRVATDMETVRDDLERVLGRIVISFAFPYGDFGQTSYNPPPQIEKGITLEEGSKRYSLLFYQDAPGLRFRANYPLSTEHQGKDSYLIKRIESKPEWRGEDLINALETSRAKELPYIESFNGNSGWIRSWGNLTINSSKDPQNENGYNSGYNEMIISSGSPEQAGAAVILDGTRMWENYDLKTRLLLPNRNSAFAWVRFQDDNNNAACNLGDGFIHIEQTVNGIHNVIKGIRDPSIKVPLDEFDFEVRVNGRYVACVVNGNVLVDTNFLDPSLSTGGIGFKTWDNVPGRGFMVIRKIEVQPILNR